jgi:8-oxo-dGTP diphosphatase
VTLQVDIFIHMDAVDRKGWQGAPDDRPLTALGQRQSEQIAHEMANEPVQAIFSSPAIRCRESLAPLSKQTGLPIEMLSGFRDTLGYKAPDGWENPDRPGADPLGGAQSAGSAFAALQEIKARVPEGRAVLCSYGDIVPALLAFLSGAAGIGMPGRNNKKGAVFTVLMDGTNVRLSSRDPAPNFPQ